MKRTLLLAALAGALPAAALLAQAPAGGPNLERAQTIAKEVCAACHGADGNSATAVNPSIAAQPAEYITLQLSHFKAGLRVNPVMQAMAATLTPEEMTAIGVYFSRQKPKGLAADGARHGRAKLFRGGDTATGVPAARAVRPQRRLAKAIMSRRTIYRLHARN
jgi:cytochrome c553